MKGLTRHNDPSSDAFTQVEDILNLKSGAVLKADGTEVLDSSGNISVPGVIAPKAGDSGGTLAAANAILMGRGTSAKPALTSVANKCFLEFRTKSSATSGDSRGYYHRHEIGGAGGGGEALRAFAKVTAAATTCRGAHISVDMHADGSCSGFGAGVDAQVLFGAAAYGNTLTALNAELYGSEGATISVAGSASFLRCVIGGDSTAIASISSNAAFLSFANAAGSGKIVDSDITALTGKAGLRVYVNGALYGYIPIVTGS